MNETEQNIYPACINCFYCKIKKSTVYCKNGHFKETNVKKILLYTPIKFECEDFESMD
jgi:hypothetical protein